MDLVETRRRQLQFEDNLVGTDMSLAEYNNLGTILRRGIIGEAFEAIQALEEHGELSEEFRNECVDIFVFFASLLNHAGISQEELENRTRVIVTKNFIKYSPATFAQGTVEEGIAKSREDFHH